MRTSDRAVSIINASKLLTPNMKYALNFNNFSSLSSLSETIPEKYYLDFRKTLTAEDLESEKAFKDSSDDAKAIVSMGVTLEEAKKFILEHDDQKIQRAWHHIQINQQCFDSDNSLESDAVNVLGVDDILYMFYYLER